MSELQQVKFQPPGHIYGPPSPHIAFWYGSHYLGETRGHPSNIDAARQKLGRLMQVLPSGDLGPMLYRLHHARATLYCGPIARRLTVCM